MVNRQEDEAVDPYSGREQSKAKHFILERYLWELAFKVLSGWDDLTYVDGFSGPWESRTKDHSDTSFMIALRVLKTVQQHYRDLGKDKRINCVFVEKNPTAYAELAAAVIGHDDPLHSFHVKALGKRFEDAVPEIIAILGRSFVLTFIDPTGWTGYPYDKISPLLRHEPGEVLINMMFDFANRFASDRRAAVEASFDPILGGPGWRSRLDPTLSEGKAMLKLFHEELRKVGRFRYVIETSIDKVLADRPHYYLAYGTRSPRGLKAFREVEFAALRAHEKNRQSVQLDLDGKRSGQRSFLSVDDLPNSVDTIVADHVRRAKAELLAHLRHDWLPRSFAQVCESVLERHMLRETNVKDICVELANEGVIEASWKRDRKHKPSDKHTIQLR